jgi:hypothetical protein
MYCDFRHLLRVGYSMDQEFYRQQALRVRDLAENADPFTRKRLLALADRYDMQAGGRSRASRIVERPVPLALKRPVSIHGRSGEA